VEPHAEPQNNLCPTELWVCVCVCVLHLLNTLWQYSAIWTSECFLSRHGLSHGYINAMVLHGCNDAQFVCHMPIGTTSTVKNYTLRQFQCKKHTYILCGKNEVLFQVKTGATHVLVTYLKTSQYILTNRKANNERYGTDTQVCGCALMTVPTQNSPRMGNVMRLMPSTQLLLCC